MTALERATRKLVLAARRWRRTAITFGGEYGMNWLCEAIDEHAEAEQRAKKRKRRAGK